MSKELVVATRNQGKMKEIKQILKAFDLRITSLADYPGAPEIIEDGKTFRQNALKKATVIAQYTRKWTMGEDSGLEVKWLNNRPGIYSARFAGEHATDKKNNLKLLRELRGVPWEQREARYRCCIALVDGASSQPDPGQHVFNGSCKGKIAFRSKGTNGFGYDPLFYVSQYDTTFGVLDPAVKDRISHRSAALEKLKKHLQKCSPRL